MRSNPPIDTSRLVALVALVVVVIAAWSGVDRDPVVAKGGGGNDVGAGAGAGGETIPVVRDSDLVWENLETMPTTGGRDWHRLDRDGQPRSRPDQVVGTVAGRGDVRLGRSDLSQNEEHISGRSAPSRVASGVAVGGAQVPSSQPANLKPSYCFAPATAPAVIERVTGNRHAHNHPSGNISTAIDSQVRAAALQLGARWSRTATNGSGAFRQGDSVTVTWSVIPDGTFIGATDVFESSEPSNLRAFMRGIYFDDSTWLSLYQRAFDRWSEVCGLRFVYEPNDDGASFPYTAGQIGVRGDVRIGGHRIDGPNQVIAYNWYPDRGDMVIDTSDRSFYRQISNDSRRLRNIIGHESGHGLGLQHVCPPTGTKLMEPWLSTAFDGPQHDDIFSAQRHYGDRYEDTNDDAIADNNDSRARASDLGALPLGRTDIDLLSIDDNSDRDFFRFTKTGDRKLTVRVTPLGSRYLEGDQVGGGQCSDGDFFDSSRIHNLGFRIYDGGGATLRTVNVRSSGLVENLTDFQLPINSGSFTIEVFGSNANSVQLYDLSITLSRGLPDTLLRVADVSAVESAEAIEVIAQLDRTLAVPVSFDYRLEGATATAGEDFVDGSGTLSIPAGELAASFSIPLIEDEFDEPNELIRVLLSNSQNVTLARSIAVATIIDNDQTLLSVGSLSVSETTGELEIPITLSTPTEQWVSVSLNPISSSAVEGEDFGSFPAIVEFRPGQVYTVASTNLIDDSLFEKTEEFVMQIINPINAGIAAGTGFITIFDNEIYEQLSSSLRVSVDRGGGDVSLVWDSVSGHDYTVFYSTDLIRWDVLPGAESITADSARVTHTFTPAEGAHRYYRVIEGFVP